MSVCIVVQVKSVGQVLFNDVIQKLGVLESDYFDLEFTDIHGVHVSTGQLYWCCRQMNTKYCSTYFNTVCCLQM